MAEQEELLSVSNLSRNFGSVAALTGVNFTVEPGEVLGVVGQRGSGKSTLIQLLSGIYPPTSGEIYWEGKRTVFRSAMHVQSLGIETVHQQPYLADNLSVLLNIYLGRELSRWTWKQGVPDEAAMLHTAEAMFRDIGMPVELLNEPAGNLSNEQRQSVTLARALCRPSRLLLLDDPLPALNYERQQKLLSVIRDLSARNVAVIISSDDLKQLFAVTDRILVLYQGNQVGLRNTSESTPREIVEMVVGSNRQEKITPVIWAFENYHAAQQQAEELRRTQQVLRQNLEAQDSLNRQLIERLRDQLEALDRLNIAIQDANRRLMTEREAERKALARELHDQVIQDLLSYNYQLEDAENNASDDSQQEDLSKIRTGIRRVVGNIRQICSDLRPPTIDSHGLSAAIRSLAHQWSEQNNIQVQLEMDPELGRLPETIELSVFRIIQEGLSNVRKHANATLVKLVLHRTPNASLVVHLIDNGQGIARPINLAVLSEGKHFGLLGISERVSLLGGTLQVISSSYGGLEMQIEIPSPYPSFNTNT